MIPVIDLQAQDALNRIEEAYTTVGFAVFTNCLSDIDQEIMNLWFNKMKEFFELPLSVKKKYLYQIVLLHHTFVILHLLTFFSA